MSDEVRALIDELAALRIRVALMENATGLPVHDAALANTVSLVWTSLAAIMVFLMQVGFAMLEAGSIRSKNTANILMKNLMDMCIGAIVFWAIGWSLAYGHGISSFAGAVGDPVYVEGNQVPDIRGSWFHTYVFEATAATIVSGAVAERTRPGAYAAHSVMMAAWIYPVVVHWIWSPTGWLSTSRSDSVLGGAIDFAGGGAVHLTGGTVALVSAMAMGPRLGRFNPTTGKPQLLPGQSPIYMVLGALLLWCAWLAFNAGSVTRPDAVQQIDPDQVDRILTCTMLSAGAGGMAALLFERVFRSGSWSVARLVNGILSGLVSITAGCSVVASFAAPIIGACGGVLYLLGSETVLNVFHIDDAVDAFAVHGLCGFWSMIATALFATPSLTYARSAGVFYGGIHLLGSNLLAATSIALWALANGTLLFRLLKYFGHLRVSKEQEMVGLDIGVNGAVDYGYDPADAPCPEFPPEYTEPAIEVLNHIGGRRGMPPSRTADDPAAAAEMAEVNEAGGYDSP